MNLILFVLAFAIGAPVLIFIFAKLVQRATGQAQRNLFRFGRTPGQDQSDEAARQAILFSTFAGANPPDNLNEQAQHTPHHSPGTPAPDHHSHHSNHGADAGHHHHGSTPSSFDSGTSHTGGGHH